MAGSNRNLLVLPGDGIGPEVMNEVRKVIAWMGKKRAVGFDIQEDVVGGAALDKHGVPLHDDTMKTALEADAVLFGSVGGPEVGQRRVQQEAGARPVAAAQGDGPIRQSAAGQGVRRAGRRLGAQARDRQGPRHHDHPRADRRRVFRRAARRDHSAQRREGSHRHAALQDQRDPPRLRRRLRAGAQAQEPGVQLGEGQRHAHRRAVAPRRPRSCTRRATRTSSSATCTPTRSPCSWCAGRRSSTSSSPTTCSATSSPTRPRC